jgi:hypothetical protein
MGENAQFVDRQEIDAPAAAPLPPDCSPRSLQTRAALRSLVSRGLSNDQAAAMIGYVVGLGRCESRWSMRQINGLLFLRNLYSNTDWGRAERLSR